MNLNKLRTFGAVAVLSLLVWVMAESQTLRSEQMTIDVGLVSEVDQASMVRDSDGSWSGRVELTLEGSAASVTAARDRLGGRVELMVGRELPSEAGDHVILLRDALRRTEYLRGAGVTISEVRPESISVSIARVTTIEAPVTVRAPAGRLEGAAQVEPARVQIRGPERVLNGLGASELEVVARLGDESLDGLLPGVDEVITDVRLGKPEALSQTWGVSIVPPTVDVTLKVRTRTRTHTIPRLPVQVVLPPPELGRWTITLSPEDTDIFDVAISGPSEGVERVISGEIRPMAVLTLSYEELERGISGKKAQIVLLPEGVQARAEDMDVGLTIERVEAPEGDPAGP